MLAATQPAVCRKLAKINFKLQSIVLEFYNKCLCIFIFILD
jgi:hypothetical protein